MCDYGVDGSNAGAMLRSSAHYQDYRPVSLARLRKARIRSLEREIMALREELEYLRAGEDAE